MLLFNSIPLFSIFLTLFRFFYFSGSLELVIKEPENTVVIQYLQIDFMSSVDPKIYGYSSSKWNMS